MQLVISLFYCDAMNNIFDGMVCIFDYIMYVQIPLNKRLLFCWLTPKLKIYPSSITPVIYVEQTSIHRI